MSPHFLSGRRIAVAGAGMSGLSFAIALRNLRPESVTPPHITIFERDTEEDAEGRQGYSLSLAGFDDMGGLIWDGNWSEVMSVRFCPPKGVPSSGIHVARKDLRRILLAAVADEIRWGTAYNISGN
ncbi:hypothetical protein B0T25DRAFT_570311 [Lasiosphaeria hispida]|uniref:FAD-binding domain-containing protein n=1 Tax=Lasiosphaeria hispida TaxID=260671 RepID=A0AAJ0HF40_9PEZI|nr:hypothetical protein B0T25DRAFT_570311 [Lasiosphaeria hispida]